MGTAADYVLDPTFANWVWEFIESQPRFYWPEDERLTYLVQAGLEDKKWYRSGDWDRGDPTEWQESTGFGAPDFLGHPGVDFRRGTVNAARLAGVSYSIIGSWYTFEAEEPGDDEPMAWDPLRVPVTKTRIEEAKDLARSMGGEHLRTKGVEFQERFATAMDADEAFRAAGNLNDVHVRIPGIETERTAKEVLREFTELADQSVQDVM